MPEHFDRTKLTPWGESYDDLAAAVVADKSAPPVLLLAAWHFRHGDEMRLRNLVTDAVALDAREAEGA